MMPLDFHLRAGGTTYHPATRTFTAVFGTGAPRMLADARGPFVETIDLAGFDPAQLIGKPVFLDHRHVTDSAVGVVIAARREGAAIVGEVQLSAADSVADVRTKVAEGVIAAVSIGYRVTQWTESRDAAGRRTKTAAAGELVEVSLVGIPADPLATIRSDSPMPTAAAVAETAQTEQTPAPQTAAAAEAPVVQEQTEQRAAAAPIIIRAHVAPTGSEDPAAAYALREEALFARMSGVEPSAGARQFMAMGFAEHAALSLRAAGETHLERLSREAILSRALGAHGTSDFPGLLTGAGHRTLRRGYELAASPLKANLAEHVTASDFRRNDMLSLGSFGLLAEVSEHGEITATGTAEAGASWQLKTFARTFALTRKALINDDLNAFGRVPAGLGQAAAETENMALVTLLTEGGGAGPIMSGGTRLFHADHKNVSAVGNALSTGGGNSPLSNARLAIRQQTGITGERLGLSPKFLLVGPELETEAEQMMAEIYPANVGDSNPLARGLTLLVEPRLTGKAWYLFAAPTSAPVLLLGHLASAPGPQISSREGWETLGREFRVVLDFGVAATDWRGAYRDAGPTLPS